MQQVKHFISNLETICKQAGLEQAIAMAKGSLPDMEAYHRSCGRIQGMDATIKIAKDLHNKMIEAADDSDLPEMKGDDNG
jgi:hypothetical protein